MNLCRPSEDPEPADYATGSPKMSRDDTIARPTYPPWYSAAVALRYIKRMRPFDQSNLQRHAYDFHRHVCPRNPIHGQVRRPQSLSPSTMRLHVLRPHHRLPAGKSSLIAFYFPSCATCQHCARLPDVRAAAPAGRQVLQRQG